MDLFQNAKAVTLMSTHDKYLTAEEDEESVTQDRNGSSPAAKWTVEFVENLDGIIRLKSYYGKYLTATNQSFLLGATGQKVAQTLPSRLDSSVEWEPVREGKLLKLKARHGQFLRANGGLPPWRNSVTHDVPLQTATKDWILWHVHVVEILDRESPNATPPPPLGVHSDSFASNSSPPSIHSSNYATFTRQEVIWIPARELDMFSKDMPRYWIWTPRDRSGEVEFNNGSWLDIKKKINVNILRNDTSYRAYLVYKLKNGFSELKQAKASVRFVKDNVNGFVDEGLTVFLDPDVDKKEVKAYEQVPHRREDGWNEIKLGDFLNESGDEGEVEMRLFETNRNKRKSGLIVKGIEVRPIK